MLQPEVKQFVLQPGSYSVRVYKSTAKVTTQYKMYNHSCDEMDRKEGQDVPVRRVFGTDGVSDLLET